MSASLGGLVAGEVLKVQVGLLGQGQVILTQEGRELGRATASGDTWTPVTLVGTASAQGPVTLRLQCPQAGGTGFFDGVRAVRVPAANARTGKPNLFLDPGMEAGLGIRDEDHLEGPVTLELRDPEQSREGLHALRVKEGGHYQRTIQGLESGKKYLFSVWKDLGAGWTREVRLLEAGNQKGIAMDRRR